jgi:type II secretory pathway predicted ATPase ExeA
MKEQKTVPQDPLEEFFGFHKMPFIREVSLDSLLSLRGQEEMQARLRLAIREQGIALVTGPGGCGKSTTLRSFYHHLDSNRYLVLYVPNPAPGLTGVYRDLLRTLGYEPTYFKPQLVSQLRFALAEVAARERRTVILFDEAHRLTDNWLEDLRMLLSANMDASSLATLVLVGHPDLSSRLRMTCHEALWGRINIRYQLKPLNLQDTAEYIAHHVKSAGYRGDALFSDGFIVKAFEYTRGLLRRINQICTCSLIAAKAQGAKIIDEAIFQRAQSDLDEDL